MKKFRSYAIFGVIVNGLATLRGFGLIQELSFTWVIVGIATLIISLPGLYASWLILRKNPKGFTLASKQVWAAALSESISLFINGLSSTGILVIIAGFIIAQQLSRIFKSQEAKEFCFKQAADD